tara:strand:+ start:101 stop:304 length:204 start_codon:yes stop_codon:yes gene_type:complete
MGEAKRRKELGLSPRQKQIELPKINKDEIQRKVRLILYKYPIIPFVFYGFAILILIVGIILAFKFYK